MPSFTAFVGIILLFLFGYRLLWSFALGQSRDKLAQSHGCAQPFLIPTLPLGLDEWIKILIAGFNKTHVQHVHQRYQQSNTWRMPMLSNTNIGTIEPANLKCILSSNFTHFELGMYRRAVYFPLLGNSIFTLDGVAWKHARGASAPAFTREKLANQYLNGMDVHVQRFLNLIPDDGASLDLQPLLLRLTFDLTTDFLFGECIGALAEPERNEPFARALDEAQHYVETRRKLQDFYWIGLEWFMRKNMRVVHGVINYYVDLALHPEKRSSFGQERKWAYLDTLAVEMKDPDLLRDQMIGVLLGGRDSTSGGIGWSFYLLARHPKIYERLRKEVIDKFGASSVGWESGNPPSYEELRALPYLRSVVNEALRLYPTVPINHRMATRDTVLPCGGGADGKSPVFIPKGQKVDYCIYALHRRKDLWGEDAEDFRPERWMENNLLGKSWEYLPFNAGPRRCAGEQYALTITAYTLARTLQRFEKLVNLDTNELEINEQIAILPGKCIVGFHKA